MDTRRAEFFASCIGCRIAMASVVLDFASTRRAYGVPEPAKPRGFGVLARAMRSSRPGIVFASAAANNEVDPLTDLDSRLLVGMPIIGRTS